MATKKVAKKNTAIVPISEEALAQQAAVAVAAAPIGGGLQFYSTRGGQLLYGGNPVKDNKVTGVILDAVPENHYYEGTFNAAAPASPVCYAYGTPYSKGTPDPRKGMAPHAKSTKPQHEKCEGCARNAFGSAGNGRRGKACKNIDKLAILPVEALDDVATAPLGYFKLPVTSLGAWGTYVRQVATLEKRPVWSVLTTVSLHSDQKNMIRVSFQLVERITDAAILAALQERQAASVEDLLLPFPEFTETTAAAPTSKRKFSK